LIFVADNRQRRTEAGARKFGRPSTELPAKVDGRTDTSTGSTHTVHHRSDLMSTPVSAITDQSRTM
jgi:hypothetical protein